MYTSQYLAPNLVLSTLATHCIVPPSIVYHRSLFCWNIMSEQHPEHPSDPADRPPGPDRQESNDSMTSWDVISRHESTCERSQRPQSLFLPSPTMDSSLPDLTLSSTEADGLCSILESPHMDMVIRRPALPSKKNRRRLVSLLDTMSLHEYYLPDTPAEKCVSTPDIPGSSGSRSPKVSRVRPVGRGESMKTERPLSWTSRSLTSLNQSITSIFRPSSAVTSLESLGSAKCSAGNYVFEFEG